MESSTSGEHENSKSNDEISNCEGTRWICPSCKLMLNDANQLGAHLLMDHVSPSITKSSIYTLAIKCPECPSSYMDSIESLLHHFDANHGSRSRLIGQKFDNLERLFVRVHKKHVNIIRPAYSGSVKSSVYKSLCGAYDSIQDNNNLLLLRDVGPPLSSNLASIVEMATPGHSFDFDVPYSCPECAVPISQLNDLREHMSTHAPNAYQVWRKSKIEALKCHVEWKNKMDKIWNNLKEKEISQEATPSTSNTNSPKKNVTPLVNKIAPPEDPSTKMMVANSPTIAEGIIPNNMVPKLLSGSQIIGNLSLLHGDPRKHKRRDLVATNRNARSKPMTAEKLLALSCMQCGLIFENRCKYTRHLLDHKMESTPYRCPMKGCMMSYDIKQKLRSHVQRKHPDISEASIELACVQGDSIFAPKTLANINVAAFLTQQKLLTESPPILQKTLQAKEELVEIDEENSSEAVDMSQLFANDSTTQIKAEENSDSKYTLLENGLLSRNGRKRKIPTQFSP